MAYGPVSLLFFSIVVQMGLKFKFRYFNKVGATKVLCLTYVGAYAQFCKN